MCMKGFLTLISCLFSLFFLDYSAAAQAPEVRDTIRRVLISAPKSPIAYTGLKRLDTKDLLGTVAILGTPDVIKSLQNLPGVSSGVELVSGLYVHGGDGSDNLFLLDGIPLFQVSHLAGIFSSFNTDVVKSIDFYKSGFPARFGGKLSSVVDVATSDGDMDKSGGSVSVGLIDGRLHLYGPIIKDRLSYDVAVRRSWLDVIASPVLALQSTAGSKKSGNYALFDANANITYLPTSRDKMNFRFFTGYDRFSYMEKNSDKYYGREIYYPEDVNELRMMWGNLAASSSWNHTVSDRSYLSSAAYYSRGFSDMYDYQKSDDFSMEDVMTSNTRMESSASSANVAGIKSAYFLNLEHHHLSAGAEYQYSWYDPKVSSQETDGDETKSADSGGRVYKTNTAVAFVEDEMVYGPFSMTAGMRLDTFFSGGYAYFKPQPRVSASYNITEDYIVKASYESMSQASHLLSSIYVDLPTNLWMPSTAIVKPSDSRQAAAGLYARFSRRWHMDISAFYRTIDNCLIYSGTTSLFPPVDKWETSFISGRGRAYGAELELRYLADRFSIDAYYTLSWSEKKFDDLYCGWFRDRFDNRHKITLSGTFKISGNIDVNATWNYHSGNRVSVPEHILYTPDGGFSLLYSEPYNAQLPDYHRLDLSCNFHKLTRKGRESVWNISIYNAYCRFNPFVMRTTSDEEGKFVEILYSYVPIIPSVSYTLKF